MEDSKKSPEDSIAQDLCTETQNSNSETPHNNLPDHSEDFKEKFKKPQTPNYEEKCLKNVDQSESSPSTKAPFVYTDIGPTDEKLLNNAEKSQDFPDHSDVLKERSLIEISPVSPEGKTFISLTKPSLQTLEHQFSFQPTQNHLQNQHFLSNFDHTEPKNPQFIQQLNENNYSFNTSLFKSKKDQKIIENSFENVTSTKNDDHENVLTSLQPAMPRQLHNFLPYHQGQQRSQLIQQPHHNFISNSYFTNHFSTPQTQLTNNFSSRIFPFNLIETHGNSHAINSTNFNNSPSSNNNNYFFLPKYQHELNSLKPAMLQNNFSELRGKCNF